MKQNPIAATVDFLRDGVQHGFLRLPHSRDDSAWGSINIPITVARNGSGSTALLTGANHGDEYEGPVALMELAHSIDSRRLKGRVIIVPAMNYPAFRAGTRTSPIDLGNLNRSFPGRSDGTVTEKIADYFQRILLPLADFVLDIHAGGRTLEFVPFACSHHLPDAKQETECLAAAEAFGAPYVLVLREIDSVGMYDSAAEEQGKIFVSTELGGGGRSTAATNEIAKRGIRNFLSHSGILPDQLAAAKSIRLSMPSSECFVFSEDDGLLEMMVDLGSKVTSGVPIARIWHSDRTGRDPVVYCAKLDGILVGRHFPGLIKSGDCMAVIASTASE